MISSDKPVAFCMSEMFMPKFFKFLAIDKALACSPSAIPLRYAPSITQRLSRYLRMPSSYFIRSSLLNELMSAICDRRSNTEFFAAHGNLFNAYIFFKT